MNPMNVCKQAPLHWGVRGRRLELVNKSQTIVFEPSCIWCKDENHSGNWTRVDKDVSRPVPACWREEDRPDYTSALLRTGKTTNICSPSLPTMTLHHPCCWPVAHPPLRGCWFYFFFLLCMLDGQALQSYGDIGVLIWNRVFYGSLV